MNSQARRHDFCGGLKRVAGFTSEMFDPRPIRKRLSSIEVLRQTIVHVAIQRHLKPSFQIEKAMRSVERVTVIDVAQKDVQCFSSRAPIPLSAGRETLHKKSGVAVESFGELFATCDGEIAQFHLSKIASGGRYQARGSLITERGAADRQQGCAHLQSVRQVEALNHEG